MTPSDAQIRSAIIQVAADWYATHRSGSLTEAGRAEFLAWLKASPIHIEEYLAIAALERPLTAASGEPAMSVDAWVELANRDPGVGVVDLSLASGRYETAAGRYDSAAGRRAGRGWLGLAVAACAGVAGIGILWRTLDGQWFGARHGPGAVRAYRTTHGQQAIWPLDDGSTLHVNTDTAVTVTYSPAERLVEIDHGQVIVEVAHNDGRPFRVHAGATDTVAVGTEFDVYRRPDATLITVVKGQVAVTAQSGAPGGLRVGAGRQVTVVAGRLPSVSEPTDLRETTAWLDRKIVFDERPLGAVADEFNRYNDITFTIDDPSLRQLSISGTFNAADTDSFAAFLGSLEGVRVERSSTRFNILNSRSKIGSKGRIS